MQEVPSHVSAFLSDSNLMGVLASCIAVIRFSHCQSNTVCSNQYHHGCLPGTLVERKESRSGRYSSRFVINTKLRTNRAYFLQGECNVIISLVAFRKVWTTQRCLVRKVYFLLSVRKIKILRSRLYQHTERRV